jgi:hypothetical protein
MLDLDPQELVNAISQVIDSFKASPPATAFSIFAFLLLLATILLAKLWSKTKITRALLVLVLVCAVLCLLVGPGLALYDARRPFQIVTRSQAFLNLRDNKHVNWLIRFIVFDPFSSDTIQQMLSQGDIPKLANPDYVFTFVASNQELRNRTVIEAVQMVGGQIRDKDHVWAIAFPLEETDETKVSLYPANARGVLQVIREIKQEKKNIISTDKSYNIDQVLSSEEQQDLEDIRSPSYVFANYRKYYTHYCTLAIDFLKVHWKEQDFMSKISDDWNPLGFSTRRTTESSPYPALC